MGDSELFLLTGQFYYLLKNDTAKFFTGTQ